MPTNWKKCDRCGKRLKAETWIYSRHSGSHYCRDLTGCAARAKKKRVKAAA